MMLSVDIRKIRSSTQDSDYQYVSEFYVTKALQRRSKSAGVVGVAERNMQNTLRSRTAVVKLSEEKISDSEQHKMNVKSYNRAAKRSDRALRIYKTKVKSVKRSTPIHSKEPNKDGGNFREQPDLSVTGVSIADLVTAVDPEDLILQHRANATHNTKSSEYGWAIDRLVAANLGHSDKWAAKRYEPMDKRLNCPVVPFQRHKGFVGSTRYADLQKRKSMPPSTRTPTPVRPEATPTPTKKESKHKYEELEFSRNSKGSLIRLGHGAFGVVYQGRCYGTTVAIKATSKDIARREAETLRTIRSVHVIKMFKTVHIGTWWCLVLEKAEVSLETVIDKRCRLQPLSVQYITASVVLALAGIHSAGWVHLDIKLGNILLNKHGKPKLCDFSSSRRWHKGEQFSDDDCYPAGSEGYWAPEIVRREPFDNMADWFSLGVCMYKMTCGDLPWILNDLDMLYKLEEGQIEYDDFMFSEDCVNIVQSLLRDNTTTRLGHSLANIRAHRWFRGVLWTNMEKGKIRPPAELLECAHLSNRV